MKKIVIFYSLDGNTRFIAENIAKTIDADLLELKLKKEINSKGFMKYFWAGKSVMTKANPELLPIDKNVQEYDLLVIGTPVWAFTYAPALNTFFEQNTIKNKKVALFCCHGGQKGPVFKKMKEALIGNEILSEIDFQEPLKNDHVKNIEKAEHWAENIIKSL
ncbi:MAG: flavodoxin [Candidatus Omnitrophica bacterium]|nr:flavodoxin [Candidatus Omnitrophota bacterium]